MAASASRGVPRPAPVAQGQRLGDPRVCAPAGGRRLRGTPPQRQRRCAAAHVSSSLYLHIVTGAVKMLTGAGHDYSQGAHRGEGQVDKFCHMRGVPSVLGFPARRASQAMHPAWL